MHRSSAGSSVGYFTLAVLACGAAYPRFLAWRLRYVSHALSYPRFQPPNLSRLCTPLIRSRRFLKTAIGSAYAIIRIARLLAPLAPLSHLALYPRSLRDYFRYRWLAPPPRDPLRLDARRRH
jgi:hypothetical protein